MKFLNPSHIKSLVAAMLVASLSMTCSAMWASYPWQEADKTEEGKVVSEGINSVLVKQQYQQVLTVVDGNLPNVHVLDWLEKKAAKGGQHVPCMHKYVECFGKALAKGSSVRIEDAIDAMTMMLVSLIITNVDVNTCKTVTEHKNTAETFNNLMKGYRDLLSAHLEGSLKDDRLDYKKILELAATYITGNVSPMIVNGSMPNPAWVCHTGTGTSLGTSWIYFYDVQPMLKNICAEKLKDGGLVEPRLKYVEQTINILNRYTTWQDLFALRAADLGKMDVGSNDKASVSAANSSTVSATGSSIGEQNEQDIQQATEQMNDMTLDDKSSTAQTSANIVVPAPKIEQTNKTTEQNPTITTTTNEKSEKIKGKQVKTDEKADDKTKKEDKKS